MSITELKEIIRNLFKKPTETILLVLFLIVLIICGFWANGYFSKKGEQAANFQKEYEP